MRFIHLMEQDKTKIEELEIYEAKGANIKITTWG